MDHFLTIEDQMLENFRPLQTSCGQINVVNIAQKQDSKMNIERVKEIIQSQKIPKPSKRKHGTPVVKKLKRFLLKLPKL